MTISSFDDNEAQAHIVKRLQAIDGVARVYGQNSLAQVLNGETTGTDGYVYVVFEGSAPIEDIDDHRIMRLDVGYSVILASQTYNRDGMPTTVGNLSGAIKSHLAGFTLPIKGTKPLRYVTQQDKAVHAYGFSLYPFRFKYERIVHGNKL